MQEKKLREYYWLREEDKRGGQEITQKRRTRKQNKRGGHKSGTREEDKRG